MNWVTYKMNKILDIFHIPGKKESGIALEGKCPKHLNIGSRIKKGDSLTVITGIPFIRPLGPDIDTGVFNVMADSSQLKIGDDVEII